MDNKPLRIIDANLNRLLEGLRVCEEISRFIFKDKNMTLSFKNLRHSAVKSAKGLPLKDMLKCRNIRTDVGKESTISELNKKNWQEIALSNIQRSKEAIRVLEEFTKVLNRKISGSFKNLRFKIYSLEKELFERL